ncbi:hypothetical protein [Streptomyces sp. SID12501]|uniref:Flotillin family protein n=1 Tax=Streptomyces sp. SID12501 TaxID=2706042 RepID=A0A6B3BLS5_9ACTN|nr:hypothetical protein [Streptomyces sp. SID12501]NEC85349.1 hypothetical protein [Streptomyces sp. SID12501]
MVAMLVGIGVLVAVCLLVVSQLFRKVEQGKALIVSKLRKVDVTFTGQVVLPVLHKAEVMDISVKAIEITRAGKDGLICQDNIRADIRISFFVKVNKTVEDVIKVAQAVGTARASDQRTLQELFHAKFSEALKTVGKQLDFTNLYTKREEFRYRIIEVIARERERETQLTRIAADKEVEAEKREIAEVVRERVVVDRTVAEQEKSIKTLRAVEEAERQQVVIEAEAEAQEQLVKDIKAAEAAVHRAAEEITLADARLKSADLDAQAKLRLAEGIQAECAAEGLAAVQVRDKEAEVIEKAGRAEAEATQARLRAEAEGVRAEAEGIGGKLKTEAAGLTEKAAAMAALDDASRGHEEYRLRLAAEKDIRLAGLDVQRQVAEAPATVLATGLENADINIVGGDSVFFDRLVSSIALGKSVDGFVQHSETAQALVKPWLDGTSSFTDDLSHVLGSVSSADVQNLTVSALLMKLMKSGGAGAGQFQQLLDKAGELGLADTPLTAVNGSAEL